MNVQPWLIGEGWIHVKDGDASSRTIFDRHYSRYVYADGRKPKLFVGPGEKIVLLRADALALCVWRKFISADGQTGVNCAVYRNEGHETASKMLLEAMEIAWNRWPGERLFTYVNPRKIKYTMERSRPVWGWCFYKAGWSFAGLTSRGLHILEYNYSDTLPSRAEYTGPDRRSQQRIGPFNSSTE